MRVYHFINAKFGLEDIRQRRLKVATIDDLNDPFELLALSQEDVGLRSVLTKVKRHEAARTGLLCFSRSWHNPVMWSHYGEKHRGLCLGFDVPKRWLVEIRYESERLALDIDALMRAGEDAEAVFIRSINTKFSHWQYEEEMRVRLNLEGKSREDGFYYAEFSDELDLREVVVGANSSITRSELSDALGEIEPSVRAIKARLAFKTFSVVLQKDAALWT